MRLEKSSRPAKKYMVRFDGKTVHFGAAGYEDFTTHGDENRKKRYLARHKHEEWGRDGVHTAGFWARWILWNKPTIQQSVQDINKTVQTARSNKLKHIVAP